MNRVNKFSMGILVSLVCFIGCRQHTPKADFTTPEGAILMLEKAYRQKDIEAAVAAKDFVAESRVMLSRLKSGMEHDPGVLKKSAEVLELSFRAEIRTNGFPSFSGLKCRFPRKEKHQQFEDIVAVTEVCTFPDGGTSTQKLLVAKTAKGWRVLNVVE
jgi:hypothetical protein